MVGENVTDHLVRTRGGLVVHLDTCRYAQSNIALPWLWARGRPLDELRGTVLRIGLRTCGHCKPLAFGRSI